MIQFNQIIVEPLRVLPAGKNGFVGWAEKDSEDVGQWSIIRGVGFICDWGKDSRGSE